MIKPTELRIGNLVSRKDLGNGEDRIETIIELGEKATTSGPIKVICGYDQLEPIPLTEQWLLKFGFEKRPAYGWKGNGYDYQPETSKTEYQDFLIWADQNAFVFRFETYSWRKEETEQWNSQTHTDIHFSGQYYEKVNERIYTMQPVAYVHQLQNLYYALTGEELTPSSDTLNTPLKQGEK